jgi:hypothetical protein
MSYRVMALVAASVLMLSGSALAQKKDPTADAVHLNTSRSNIYKGGGAGVTTVKSSKSNSSDRMGGGGGGKGAAGVTAVKSSKSNSSDRMGGGGGGKGAGQLNPQPEPPGRR